MENKALYVMAGYDDETENHLAGIQNKLYDAGFTGTHTKNIPQHITLCSYPVEQEEMLKEKLSTIAEKFAAFDICFTHVGIFGGGNVLFIAPDKNKKLIELGELFGNTYGWPPHTTMLIDEPENIKRALPMVLNEFSQFSGKVTSLHLYEFWPTRPILTVHFK